MTTALALPLKLLSQQVVVTISCTFYTKRHNVTHGLSLLLTGPCDPVNVTSFLQCNSNMATVSWDHAAGVVGYTVFARQDKQLVTSCRTNSTTCLLNQLECGKVYTLTVTAESTTTCNSSGNNSAILKTGRKEEFPIKSVSLTLDLFLSLRSMLAFCSKQLPDLQHQCFTVVLDTNGGCHRLCSKCNCNKWTQSFLQHSFSYVHSYKSPVWSDLHSFHRCTGQ